MAPLGSVGPPWAALGGLLCALLGAAVVSAERPGGAVAVGEAHLSPSETRVLQQVCGACHAHPGIGVPVMGDEAAWTPLREKGLETLLRNSVEGFGGMPPLGTCSWCSESELRRIVAWMAGLPLPAP